MTMKSKIFALSLLGVGLCSAACAAADLESQVKEKYGQECKILKRCGGMIYVDCNSPADGPAYYLEPDLEIIGTGGGFCMMECSGPPAKWQECKKGNFHD